ncbi:hypothetical protein FQN54_009192 [Arachnomyces sp. PD_36]|nr:hypothetical protein FQN54_009192 [Arachnomyces sp. PD_36]
MAVSEAFLELEVASIFFGFFFGVFIFTATKVTRQTWGIWKRSRRLMNIYVWMIWVELIVNFVFALTTYLYLRGVIKPSFAYFFGAVTLWAFQTQLLIQIIANRVGLIMVDKRKSRLIKWSLFLAIGLINISVFCIWIPALMGVSHTFVTLNHIWERVEKSLFLVIDFGLNVYFLYHVRSRLIAKGLAKYWPLFNFNVIAVIISVSMDALLLGMLSLPNQYESVSLKPSPAATLSELLLTAKCFSYVQFAPVVYTIKLNIELTMAELISKVVRSSNRDNSNPSSHRTITDGTQLTSRNNIKSHLSQSHSTYFAGTVGKDIGGTNTPDGAAHENDKHQGGIMKTVTVQMDASNGEDREDSASATAILRASVEGMA